MHRAARPNNSLRDENATEWKPFPVHHMPSDLLITRSGQFLWIISTATMFGCMNLSTLCFTRLNFVPNQMVWDRAPNQTLESALLFALNSRVVVRYCIETGQIEELFPFDGSLKYLECTESGLVLFVETRGYWLKSYDPVTRDIQRCYRFKRVPHRLCLFDDARCLSDDGSYHHTD